MLVREIKLLLLIILYNLHILNKLIISDDQPMQHPQYARRSQLSRRRLIDHPRLQLQSVQDAINGVDRMPLPPVKSRDVLLPDVDEVGEQLVQVPSLLPSLQMQLVPNFPMPKRYQCNP